MKPNIRSCVNISGRYGCHHAKNVLNRFEWKCNMYMTQYSIWHINLDTSVCHASNGCIQCGHDWKSCLRRKTMTAMTLNTDWRETHPRLSARTTQVSNTCQLQQHFKSNTSLSREPIVAGRETEKVKPVAGTLIWPLFILDSVSVIMSSFLQTELTMRRRIRCTGHMHNKQQNTKKEKCKSCKRKHKNYKL